jgi:hypothetical protein
MSQYKLVTYQSPQGPRAGLVLDEAVYDLSTATGRAAYVTMLDVLRDWDAAKGLLQEAAAAAAKKGQGRPLSGTKLLPPVPTPAGIFCAGANFSDHMLEMAKVQNIAPEPDPHDVGLKPWHFIKAQHCLVAPDSTVKLPEYSKMVDWEVELTAVIGRPARNVSIARSIMSPAIPSPTISPRAISPSGRMSPTPRRSNTTGSHRNASRAPARSGPGSCRRTRFRIRKTSASSYGSTTSSSRTPTRAR